VKDIACDPLAVTAGWTVNHEASRAAGFAGQMLDAECQMPNAECHGGRPDLAIRLGDPVLAVRLGRQPCSLIPAAILRFLVGADTCPIADRWQWQKQACA